MCNKKERKRDRRWYLFPVSTLGAVYFAVQNGTGRGFFFFEAGRGGCCFFAEAGRGGCFFFPRRDGVDFFFFFDGTAEPVSRDQILRHARGQRNIHFPCSADHEEDWQPYLFFFRRDGRGGVVFFFSRTGTGRLFLAVAFFLAGRGKIVTPSRQRRFKPSRQPSM